MYVVLTFRHFCWIVVLHSYKIDEVDVLRVSMMGCPVGSFGHAQIMSPSAYAKVVQCVSICRDAAVLVCGHVRL